MAVLPIVKYGDPVLRTPTSRVETIDREIQDLIDDMVETMYAAPGVGLAANQVGVSKRLMIIDLTVGEEPGNLHVFINPDFIEKKGEIIEDEGCLSIPDQYAEVLRPDRVRARWQERDGTVREEWIDGLLAVCLQHEIDHLNGVLFIDHLSRLKRDMIMKKLVKARREMGAKKAA